MILFIVITLSLAPKIIDFPAVYRYQGNYEEQCIPLLYDIPDCAYPTLNVYFQSA